ncbi:pseudouridine synthase 1 [Brevipalpus obovatus]|uniref:pseudouridine synthase 1 n=1 Tax=Brevipalpus obovatus TaxID=246614 RepID=UPI003D9DE469
MSNPVSKRVKGNKFALLLSYCGVGYFGLQKNKNVRTIESDLFDAMLKIGIITQKEYDRPQDMYFQRAARTDKGVSALRQILSCRLPKDFPEKIDLINSHLVPQIRLIAAKRATRYFDSKNFCDYRTYAYMMPSYALCRIDETVNLDFRATRDHITSFNKILSRYLGTHNYHNFTSQRAATDASSQRYIMSIECSDPFVRDDLEFVIVRVRGQSFMLHQIRKMMGLALGIQRGFTTESSFDRAFDLHRIDIPVAPGLGLMLEEVHYDKYNNRFGGDEIHEPLVWDEYSDTLRKFADEFIYPVIVNTEKQELSMIKWLQLLPIHSFDIRGDGPPSLPLSCELHQPEKLSTEPASESSEPPLKKEKRERTLYMDACLKGGVLEVRSKAQDSTPEEQSSTELSAEYREVIENSDAACKDSELQKESSIN